MRFPVLNGTFLSTSMITMAIFVVIAIASPTPAHATKGREAVGMCIDSTANGSRCAWGVNDKGEIDICNKNGCVYCPSADGDCVVASKTRPKPVRTFPVGATVTIESLGSFKVSPHAPTGSLVTRKSAEIKK